MRITREQSDIICQCLKQYFGETSQIWLFGSRANDDSRGGDIDLYIETPLQNADAVINGKLRALVEIKRMIGDQKIDLVIHRQGHAMEAIHYEARILGYSLMAPMRTNS